MKTIYKTTNTKNTIEIRESWCMYWYICD